MALDTRAIASNGYYPKLSAELNIRVESNGYLGTLPTPTVGTYRQPKYTEVAMVGKLRL